jgi:hypothetical protein
MSTCVIVSFIVIVVFVYIQCTTTIKVHLVFITHNLLYCKQYDLPTVFDNRCLCVVYPLEVIIIF